jgi:DNA-binding ferritin-like protein (Dps family)
MSDFDSGKAWDDYVAQHPEQFPGAPKASGNPPAPESQSPPPVFNGPDGRQYQFDDESWRNLQIQQRIGQEFDIKALGQELVWQKPEDLDVASPGFQPGYWDKPRNVASAYYQIKAAPPGTAPDWATGDTASTVTQLYDYFKQKNPGKPWYEWDYLQQDDPVREIIQTLPGLDATQPAATGTTVATGTDVTTPLEIPQTVLDELRTAKPEDLATLPDDVVGLLPGDLQTMVKQAKTQPAQAYTPGGTPQLINGMPAADWNKLPKSEQLMYAILPAVGKAMAPVMGAVAGFGVGGPAGAVAGAGVMTGAQALAPSSSVITGIFNALQWPAQTAEKVFGVLDQGFGEGIQATKQGGFMAGADAVAAVLNHLPEAMQAGALDYEANVAGAYRPEDMQDWGQLGTAPKAGAQPVVYGWKTNAQGQQEMLVTPWTPELRTQAMQEARQRIIGGEKVSDVMNEIGARFGVRGQVRDMAMQMALDPLNLIPGIGQAAATKILGGAAKAAETAGELGKAAELGKWAGAVEKESDFLKATRRLGVEVRAMPVEQTKSFSAFTKWVSGLDAAGELKIYQTGKAMTLGERVSGALFQPTPQARAWAMLGNASNALDPVMPASEDPLVNAARFKQIAAKDPAMAVAADQASGLPKYWDSAEAQPLTLAMREATDDVDAIAGGFANQGNQAKRAAIGKLAQVIEGDGYEAGKSEFKLIKSLAEGDEAHANVVARQLKNKALDGLGDLTGKQLKELVDPYFKGELDFTPQQANAKMKYAILSAVDKYSATAFGVKPNPWLVRFADAIKRAQSRIVLGLNPVYPLNNAINNLITLAYDGNLGNFSGAASDEWWTAMEMDPMKGHQGMGSGGDFAGLQAQGKMKNQPAPVGEAVRAASTAEPTGNVITDLPEKMTKAVSGAPKLTPTSEWSAKLEQAQAMQAMTTAAKRYFYQEWPKVVDGTPMSPQLRGVLDLVRPGLAEQVTKAIKAGLSKADIERSVFKDLGRKSLAKTMVPEDLALLKAHFPKVEAEIDQAIGKATTDGEVNLAFAKQKLKMARQVVAEKARALPQQTAGFLDRIHGEGKQAIVDIRHDLAAERSDLVISSDRSLDEGFATANKMTGMERSEFIDAMLAEQNELWKAHQSKEHAAMAAMLKSTGVKDAEFNKAMLGMQDVNDYWTNFYQTKGEEARQLYINIEAGIYPESQAIAEAWDAFHDLMDKMYQEATDLENENMNQFQEIFANSFEEQFPGGKADALAWWQKPLAVRREYEEAVKYFRSRKGKPSDELKVIVDDILDHTASGKPTRGMTSYESTAAWKRFTTEVKEPLMRKEIDAIHGGSKEVLRGPATGSSVANGQAQAIPVMITNEMRGRLAGLGYTAEDIRNLTPEQAWDVLQAKTAKVQPAAGSVSTETGPALKTYLEQKGRTGKYAQETVDNMLAELEKAVNERRPLAIIGDDVEQAAFKEVAEKNGYQLGEWVESQQAGTKQASVVKGGELKTTLESAAAQGNVSTETAHAPTTPTGEQPAPAAELTGSAEKRRSTIRKTFHDNLPQELAPKNDAHLLNIINETRKARGLEPVGKLEEATQADVVNAVNFRKGKHMEPGAIDEGNRARVEEIAKQLEAEQASVSIETVPADETGAVTPENTTLPVSVKAGTPPEQPIPAMRAPLGSAEGEAPILNAQAEGWVNEALPLLERARQSATGEGAHAWGAFDMEKELPPEAAAQLRAYLGGVVEPAMADTKYRMLQYANQAHDMSLLDYTRRMGFDNWLGTVFPYQFWYTRSMLNWGLRVMSRPAIAANYARLTSLNDKYSNRVQTPTRLQHKFGIPFPWLPDGWGDTVYVDPLKQAFPFATMLRPFETESDNQNMLMKKTQGYLQDMVDAEEITQTQADQALQTQQGATWEQALAQAQEDMDNTVTNPLSGETATTGGFRNATDAIDFASTIVGLSLPLQMAYYWNTGRKDRISQMPITRLVQNATGALGVKGGQGYNLEGMIRGAAGMPAVSSLDEYYIDRELANLAAEGKISAQDAMDGMASKQGNAYAQATQQVRAQGLLKQFGAPLGVDVYPEGEAESRALQGEYDKVAAAAAAGDTKAWNAFYAAHPEAAVRSLSYKSTQPEVLMQKFLTSAIWDRYNGLNPLDKKQAAKQLGELFQDAFLNKATRSYDSISNDTLIQWAQMMDAHLPTGVGGAQQGQIKFTDPAVSQAYQGYLDEKQAKFAGIDTLLNVYYGLDADTQQAAFEAQHPEIGKYLDWRTTYLAEHPAVIPSTMGETNELYGLPAETQTEVYQYRAQRIKEFPNIDEVQNAYFGIDPNDSKATARFKDEHPELEEYWDWRREFAAQYPKAAPYILSDQSLSNAIKGVGTVPADAKAALDEYKAQKEKRYPGIDAKADAYGALAAGSAERTTYLKSHPELPEYWTWKRQFAADHATAATYILGETGVSQAISGINRSVPLDLQPVLDYFYNERDQLYPGITDTESGYFNVAAGAQRKAYLAQHPELQQYWDWRSMFEASAPEITLYTRSTQWLSNKILPAAQRQQVLAKATPMLATQLMALATKQGQLGAGGQMELQRLWEEAGKPMGDFDTFVKALVGQ